jgi:restriction endonuclease S subunit
MASNYKRLGNYIQQVDVRNTDLSVELLLGVSIEKKFIESHANTVGTDFSKYKIVKRGQFAYGPVTSRNGDKISIALLDEADACLISSSYTPFEIVKPDELNAEYLMMLFRNPEYDRFARYNSWGSAREVFSWEDFCDSELYIPDIEEQQKIVRQYKTITDRIEVLEKINEKLIELCKTQLQEYKPILENAKSTSFIPIRDLVSSNCENYSSKDKWSEIVYLDTGSITDNFVSDVQIIKPKEESVPSRCKRKVKNGDIIFSTVRPGNRHFGIIYSPAENFIVSTGFSVLSVSQDRISAEFIYLWLTSEDVLGDLNEIAELSVTTYPSISNDDLMDVIIEVPDDYDFSKMNGLLHSAMLTIDENSKELRKLQDMKHLYLGMRL